MLKLQGFLEKYILYGTEYISQYLFKFEQKLEYKM